MFKSHLLLPSLLTATSLVAGCVAVPAQTAAPAAQTNMATPISLVSQGQSQHSIVVAPGVPESVKEAVQDLQSYIQKSSKAKLPVISNGETPTTPFIAVGDTAAARAAGLSTKGMPWSSFRIITRGDNIFILGPDEEKTPEGGTSEGSANGVYTFLEDYFNVRWLMPGKMGDDVPPMPTVSLPPLDRTEIPVFESRRVTHLQNSPEAKQWERRHKLGQSLNPRTGHNWSLIKPALYDQHPDWFPLVDGKRIPPVHTRYKIETTNPELVKYFANQIIQDFRKNPNLYMVSMSPSDGSSDKLASWSESPETRALLEKRENGKTSYTKLILKFYNDIAKIVGKEFPDRKVGGYIYSSYLYPPKNGVGKLEPNLFITVAMSPSYGYQGYRPQVQEVWAKLLKAWSEETSNISYYDLPTWVRYGQANLTPPAPELMNFMFPLLKAAKVRGSYIYGTEEWAYAGVNNYTLAEMTWDPTLDAYAVNREFYRRGFGEAAAPYMEQLYQTLDAAVKKHYIADNRANFNATPPYMKNVVAANFPTFTDLFLKAVAAQKADATTTPGQKARLYFFGDNMILTNYRLVKLGAIKQDVSSPLYRTRAQINKMIGKVNPDFGVKLASGYKPDEDEYHRPTPKNNRVTDQKKADAVLKNTKQTKPKKEEAAGPINTDSF